MSFIIIIYLCTILKKNIYEDILCSVEKMKISISKYNCKFSFYLFYNPIKVHEMLAPTGYYMDKIITGQGHMQ